MSEHTALPWRHSDYDDRQIRSSSEDKFLDRTLCSTNDTLGIKRFEEERANAALIVQSVNDRPALIAERNNLKRANDLLQRQVCDFANTRPALIAERDALREALTNVLRDIADYERVNNLAPSPGQPDCWQSVAHARALVTRPDGQTILSDHELGERGGASQ